MLSVALKEAAHKLITSPSLSPRIKQAIVTYTAADRVCQSHLLTLFSTSGLTNVSDWLLTVLGKNVLMRHWLIIGQLAPNNLPIADCC